MLFNRRESGEVERIPLDAYRLISDTVDDDVYMHLSAWEKRLCQALSTIEVRGERGRKVPVLLTKELSDCIDRLVQKRSAAGVCTENPYTCSHVQWQGPKMLFVEQLCILS